MNKNIKKMSIKSVILTLFVIAITPFLFACGSSSGENKVAGYKWEFVRANEYDIEYYKNNGYEIPKLEINKDKYILTESSNSVIEDRWEYVSDNTYRFCIDDWEYNVYLENDGKRLKLDIEGDGDYILYFERKGKKLFK